MEKVTEAASSRGAYHFMNDVRGVKNQIQNAFVKENATRLFSSLTLDIQDEETKKVLPVLAELSVNEAVTVLDSVANLVQAKVIDQANKSNIGGLGLSFDAFRGEKSEETK